MIRHPVSEDGLGDRLTGRSDSVSCFPNRSDALRMQDGPTGTAESYLVCSALEMSSTVDQGRHGAPPVLFSEG